jgi:putative membrane protein
VTTPPDRATTSPGAAAADERTDLAWNRSGLALLACGLVVARGLSLSGLPPPRVATGAVILGLGALTYVLAAWHAQRRLRPGRTEVAATTADLLPVAIGIAIVGVAAFVLGAVFPA